MGKVNICHEKTWTKIISKLNLRSQSLHLICIYRNEITAMKIIRILVELRLERGLMKKSRRKLFRKVQILRLIELSNTLLQANTLKVSSLVNSWKTVKEP